MKQKFKQLLKPLIGYGCAALIILTVLGVIALVSGSLMCLLGFTYQSLGSMLLFFFLSAVAGFPAELLAKGLPKALLFMKKLTLLQARLLFLALDVLATSAAMIGVDALMDSVTATKLSIFAIALLMALAAVRDINIKKE